MKNTYSNKTIISARHLRLATLIVGLVLVSISSTFGQQILQGTPDRLTGWRKISAPTSGFEALMPGPTRFTEELLESDGTTMKMRMYQSETDLSYFAVGSIDMSSLFSEMGASFTPRSREIAFDFIFEVAEAEMIAKLPKAMKLEKVGDTTFNGAKGRLYLVKLFEGTLGEFRFLHHKDKVYMLMATDLSDDRAANFRRFHSSIKFL